MATLPRYSNAQILLHWLTAPLVILIISLPYFEDFFSRLLGGGAGVFIGINRWALPFWL
ncbi:hypothetical protein VPH49_12095 [Pseudomonas luteola]|uniref:hypothetical protein n=1 Tax=Pseudomonas luteola TaxID=47886 RepID=UPI003A8B96F2